MLSAELRTRTGVTLVESIVAMTVGGVVLALVAAIGVRQQRLHADIADRAALAGQLRQAATILPIELRGVASGAGDIRDARDTAIEIRSTFASAVVCDTTAGSLILAPSVAGDSTYAGFLAAVAAGDTAWLLTPGDSADIWQPYAVSATSSSSSGHCASTGPQLRGAATSASRSVVRLASLPSLESAIGSVVRITRPMRYSLYRGGDNQWYLGARDWNVTSMRFNTIQPVSGPFASASGHGLAFQYFDSSGVLLPSPVTNPRVIALIRVGVRGQSRNVMRAFAAGPQGKSQDSATIVVALHNRR